MLRTAATTGLIVIASSMPSFGATIIVERGDTLAELAFEYLGSANQWPELCESNRDVIGANCDNLHVGLELTVPDAAGGTATQAPAPQPTSDLNAASAEPQSGISTQYVFGPLNFSQSGWTTNLETQAAEGSQAPALISEVGLLRKAVWSPAAEQWLTAPSSYELDESGSTTISFTTAASDRVRVYPLRAQDGSGYAYVNVGDLQANTAYTASWTVEINANRYILTDFAVSKLSD
jgi:hypothetical protein